MAIWGVHNKIDCELEIDSEIRMHPLSYAFKHFPIGFKHFSSKKSQNGGGRGNKMRVKIGLKIIKRVDCRRIKKKRPQSYN